MQYPLAIHLIEIKLDLENDTQSAFVHRTAIINPVALAKFFHILCNTVFILLLIVGQLEKRLLGPISNYFATVEKNGCGILHLHCLV